MRPWSLFFMLVIFLSFFPGKSQGRDAAAKQDAAQFCGKDEGTLTKYKDENRASKMKECKRQKGRAYLLKTSDGKVVHGCEEEFRLGNKAWVEFQRIYSLCRRNFNISQECDGQKNCSDRAQASYERAKLLQERMAETLTSFEKNLSSLIDAKIAARDEVARSFSPGWVRSSNFRPPTRSVPAGVGGASRPEGEVSTGSGLVPPSQLAANPEVAKEGLAKAGVGNSSGVTTPGKGFGNEKLVGANAVDKRDTTRLSSSLGKTPGVSARAPFKDVFTQLTPKKYMPLLLAQGSRGVEAQDIGARNMAEYRRMAPLFLREQDQSIRRMEEKQIEVSSERRRHLASAAQLGVHATEIAKSVQALNSTESEGVQSGRIPARPSQQEWQAARIPDSQKELQATVKGEHSIHSSENDSYTNDSPFAQSEEAGSDRTLSILQAFSGALLKERNVRIQNESGSSFAASDRSLREQLRKKLNGNLDSAGADANGRSLASADTKEGVVKSAIVLADQDRSATLSVKRSHLETESQSGFGISSIEMDQESDLLVRELRAMQEGILSSQSESLFERVRTAHFRQKKKGSI